MSKHSFEPRKRPGRLDYQVQFFHPVHKKSVTRGLDTRDRDYANLIAEQLKRLCANRALWDPTHKDLSGFDWRAKRAFFGSPVRSAEIHRLLEHSNSLLVALSISIVSGFAAARPRMLPTAGSPTVETDKFLSEHAFLLGAFFEATTYLSHTLWHDHLLLKIDPILARVESQAAKALDHWTYQADLITFRDGESGGWHEYSANHGMCLLEFKTTVAALRAEIKSIPKHKNKPRRAP